MATGEHQDEATADAGRRRRWRHEVRRPRDDGRDVATSWDTSGFACVEHDGNQGGSVDCQGENREGEDGQDSQIEENDQGKDRQGYSNGHESDDDEADAKSRAGPESRRRWCSAASDYEAPKKMSDPPQSILKMIDGLSRGGAGLELGWCWDGIRNWLVTAA
jgi:hypothetical protein